MITLRKSAVALLAAFAGVAAATEGGGGMYPNGAEGIMAGALPPPGLYYLNYLTHYSADRLNDKDGNKLPVDFKVNATVNVSRIVYMTEHRILGGNLGFYGLVPLVHVNGSLSPAPGVKFSRSTSAVGDIAFSPFVLAWHSKNWHSAAGLEITAPTGQYDKNQVFNVGRNYWSYQPVFAGTYLTDNGWEFSGKFMYDINARNRDTDYKSGQEFHADYAVAYHSGAWTYVAQGYYYQQVSDDHGGTAAANNGNRGRVFAIGPAIKYDFQRFSLEAKYQKEMLVENRAQGDKFWLRLVLPF